jgi:hypothetical protein
MTQDEIIEMWGEVVKYAPSEVRITEFAKLVAAKAIAELESKEPVGWIDSKGNMLCVKINESCRPLYTHPPKRTWVGLTDEEMQAIVDAQPLVSNINIYFKAVENKLKEKNT